MSQDITKLLQEATKDLLTEETLKLITEAVEKKADDKVQLAVEAALVKQDEEYASKLKDVLEAIDADHTAKLDKIVTRIDETHSTKFQHALKVLDENHSEKLTKIVGLYESALKTEAATFKKSLVEQISNFIELYIDKAIPAQQIQEATENARSRKIVNEVKRLVGLNEEFVNENIKEALIDGKQQIDEANSRTAEVEKKLADVTEKCDALERQLFLEHKLANFPETKKSYMMRVLSEKNLNSIKENFDYVASLFDKQEQDEVETLKESANPKTKGVDVAPAPEVVNESKSSSSADDEGSSYVKNTYVSEFTKRI